MDKRTKGIVTVGVLMIIVMVAVIIGVVVKRAGNISSGGGGISGTKQDMTLDEMYNELDVEQATPVKGTVTLDTPDLYDDAAVAGMPLTRQLPLPSALISRYKSRSSVTS